MEKITLRTLKTNHKQAAERLKKVVEDHGVEFTEDRLNILRRADGALRVRICGGKTGWKRVDFDPKRRVWEDHGGREASKAA